MRLGGRFGRGGMGRGGSSKPGGILFFFFSFSFSVTVSGVVAAGLRVGIAVTRAEMTFSGAGMA